MSDPERYETNILAYCRQLERENQRLTTLANTVGNYIRAKDAGLDDWVIAHGLEAIELTYRALMSSTDDTTTWHDLLADYDALKGAE